VPAALYHGGLARKEREATHRAFIEGDVPVVVSTNAFGMGIDKPDVRVVAHFDVPGSIDAYQQEMGRAGRDGAPASAVLYYRPEDLGVQRFFRGASVDDAAMRAVLGACGTDGRAADRIAADAGLSRRKTTIALDRLATAGAVHRVRGRWSRNAKDADRAITVAREAGETLQRVEQSRLEMMSAYAETSSCRRVVLLGYYGEQYSPPCGRCDNCRDHDTGLTADGTFVAGEQVEHQEWGAGTVMTVADDRLVVLFGTHGYRTLSKELVLEGGLLTPAGEA
jgi:ATP-dependent DNA helicase RecQ